MQNKLLLGLWCGVIALVIGAFILYGPDSQLQSSDDIEKIVEIQIGTNTTKLGRDFVKTDTFNATGNHSYVMEQGNYFCWDYDCNCVDYENETGWRISTCQ